MEGLRSYYFSVATDSIFFSSCLILPSKPKKYFLLIQEFTHFPFNEENADAADDANAILSDQSVKQAFCYGGNISIEPFASYNFKEKVDEN